MATVKIVDTFNGWEGTTTYASRAAAEDALARMREAFYGHPGTQHAIWCKTIVPSSWTWGWNEPRKSFVWGP